MWYTPLGREPRAPPARAPRQKTAPLQKICQNQLSSAILPQNKGVRLGFDFKT